MRWYSESRSLRSAPQDSIDHIAYGQKPYLLERSRYHSHHTPSTCVTAHSGDLPSLSLVTLPFYVSEPL